MVMSLMVAPELVAAAAADLTGIGQAISAANAAAAGPTTQVLAAAGDEVSAAIAALFGTHAQEYQALSARVATFHEQFVRSLTAAGSAYATAEAANASPLQALEQQVLGAINAPTQLWLGRPLIGDGVHGAPSAATAPPDPARAGEARAACSGLVVACALTSSEAAHGAPTAVPTSAHTTSHHAPCAARALEPA
ncbi:PE family protein, partial [Mycobacterium tuberculosis]|uniref:PE family protein n=1 Tax=Mycobacterium tuberculosis TaxID=1773 RepID=UPI00214E5D9D